MKTYCYVLLYIVNLLAATHSDEEYFDTTDQTDPVKQVELDHDSKSDEPTPGDDDPAVMDIDGEAAVMVADQGVWPLRKTRQGCLAQTRVLLR